MVSGTIYSIINKVNKKRYIGQSICVKKRIYKHFKKLEEGQHCNPYLQKSYNKYGRDNFRVEIVEENIKEDLLNEREIYWMGYFDTYEGEGYNLIPGGGNVFGEHHPFYGRNHSKETKEKISQTRIKKGVAKGENNPMFNKGYKVSGQNNGWYDKELPEEVKEKMSKAAKERKPYKHTEETKQKLSKMRQGSKNPMWGVESPMKGKKLSEEAIKKLSEAHKGKELSEKHKNKISNSVKGSKNPRSKITVELSRDIIEEYFNSNKSYKKVAEIYDTNPTTICSICNGKHWTVKENKDLRELINNVS